MRELAFSLRSAQEEATRELVSREPAIGWSKIDQRSFGELDVVCALFPHALTVCGFRA